MYNITFIIGSGFSIHAGLPSTSEINKKLLLLTANDFVYDAMGSYFLNGRYYPNNEFERVIERKFFVAFRDFYISEELDNHVESFHYEKFYDFFMQNLRESTLLKYVNFAYNNRFEYQDPFTGETDPFHRIDDLYYILQGLVTSLIKSVKLDRSHLIFGQNSYLYKFCQLIKTLSTNHIIHFASLNHDCYIERLGYSEIFEGKLEDGFEENGSEFYGELDLGPSTNLSPSSYKVKLSRFTNTYNGIYRLYKLHGGIDQYWYQDNSKLELLKLKNYIPRHRICREVCDNQEFKYLNNIVGPIPNFLTGVNSKLPQYGKDYFRQLFKRFNDALNISRAIVTIGYGFKDYEINKCIVRFLHSTSIKIHVIDIANQIPNTMQSNNIYFHKGGIEDFDLNALLNEIT